MFGIFAVAALAEANPLSEAMKGHIQDGLFQMGVANVQITPTKKK